MCNVTQIDKCNTVFEFPRCCHVGSLAKTPSRPLPFRVQGEDVLHDPVVPTASPSSSHACGSLSTSRATPHYEFPRWWSWLVLAKRQVAFRAGCATLSARCLTALDSLTTCSAAYLPPSPTPPLLFTSHHLTLTTANTHHFQLPDQKQATASREQGQQ